MLAELINCNLLFIFEIFPHKPSKTIKNQISVLLNNLFHDANDICAKTRLPGPSPSKHQSDCLLKTTDAGLA
ncbi:hypothetical protein A5320_04560 [Rheinheimera sp. SA_1]|nr:hypothetical protein A5320_04560 [Rheinheimera sp. SA_1]